MSVGTITKQPSEELNSSVDFVDIMPAGDTLTLISVTATKGGASSTASVIATSPAPAVSGTKVTFRVIDGADCERHKITVKISDSSGEKYEADVDLMIIDQ